MLIFPLSLWFVSDDQMSSKGRCGFMPYPYVIYLAYNFLNINIYKLEMKKNDMEIKNK